MSSKKIKILIPVYSLCLVRNVCFHSAMKHENVSNMIGFLSYENLRVQFTKEMKQYTCALYVAFFFIKAENSNFIKERKPIFYAFIAW